MGKCSRGEENGGVGVETDSRDVPSSRGDERTHPAELQELEPQIASSDPEAREGAFPASYLAQPPQR